jgi:hypothetical protein
MHDLMNKLALSKKIMDKHNELPRNNSLGMEVNENTNRTYNIPENIADDFEEINYTKDVNSSRPINEEAVMKSKLPEEIKRLMIENPISKPEVSGPVLSDKLIAGATRLMGNTQKKENTKKEYVNEDLKSTIKSIVEESIRDIVREELRNFNQLNESSQKTNEAISIRVGKHIFEGKISKVKKID